MRKIISTILLAVYTIVLGHSVVPHHHHFEDSGNPDFYCELDKQQNLEGCCEYSLNAHNHEDHHHQPCNFNGKIILTKSGSFSALFLPASSVEMEFSDKEERFFYDNYTSKLSSDRNSRHILLRGPPRFS